MSLFFLFFEWEELNITQIFLLYFVFLVFYLLSTYDNTKCMFLPSGVYEMPLFVCNMPLLVYELPKRVYYALPKRIFYDLSKRVYYDLPNVNY